LGPICMTTSAVGVEPFMSLQREPSNAITSKLS